MLLPVFLVSSLLFELVYGQNCSGLRVGRDDPDPIPGAGLSVCSVTGSTCCTQGYIDTLQSQLGAELLEGLRDEFENTGDIIEDLLEDLASYYEDDFTEAFDSNIPFADSLSSFVSNADISTITADINRLLQRTNFNIDSDNPEVDFSEVLLALLNNIEQLIEGTGLSETQQTCVADTIRENVNQTSLDIVARNLEEIRRSFSALTRISGFINNFDATLDGITVDSFPSQCVSRLIEITICGRCQMNIPPTCNNTCNALARGCFAGFYSALFEEFENLWSIVRRLVQLSQSAIEMIALNENTLLNEETFQQVFSCIGGMGFGRRKRQAHTFERLPSEVMSRVGMLNGAFKYESDGLEFCEVEETESDFCAGNRVEGGRIRSCATNQLCFSNCRCWDGNMIREDQMATTFMGVTIEDQAENPVISISEDEFNEIVASVGTPVSAFLQSDDFTAVVPEDLMIGGGDDDNGSVGLLVSIATLLVCLVLAVMS